MPLGLQSASLNFENLEEIGQEGKNSSVFKAHDKQLDGEIVIKQIEKHKIVNPTEFYSEAKILYASSHQYVVKVNYGCEDDDYVYIAMPYYRKGSLKKLIDSKFLTIRETIRYALQFLSGLHHIHSKGLIHFDIKPDNILLSDSNEALLSDFGLAKAMDAFGLSKIDVFYNKQAPPEVFYTDEFNYQYDIYLAGLTLYRLVNGNKIFYDQIDAFNGNPNGYINAILKGQLPDRDSFLPHIPNALRKIIKKAISVDPTKRHSSVLELINEIGKISDNIDWRYSIVKNNERWEKILADKKIVIDFENLGNKFAVNSYKVMSRSGKKIRIKDYCLESDSEKDVFTLVKLALKDDIN